MPQAETFRLTGYRELMRACARGEAEAKKYTYDAVRQAGDIVKTDAINRFTPIDARTAAGFRTGVRQSGVRVYQSRRKTTGRRPDYGAKQMRTLIGSMRRNQDRVERKIEDGLARIERHFEGGL